MAKENEDDKVLASLAKRQVDAGLDKEEEKVTDKVADIKDKVTDKLGDAKDTTVDTVKGFFNKDDSIKDDIAGVKDKVADKTSDVAEQVTASKADVTDEPYKISKDVDSEEAVNAFATRFTKGNRKSSMETIDPNAGVTVDNPEVPNIDIPDEPKVEVPDIPTVPDVPVSTEEPVKPIESNVDFGGTDLTGVNVNPIVPTEVKLDNDSVVKDDDGLTDAQRKSLHDSIASTSNLEGFSSWKDNLGKDKDYNQLDHPDNPSVSTPGVSTVPNMEDQQVVTDEHITKVNPEIDSNAIDGVSNVSDDADDVLHLQAGVTPLAVGVAEVSHPNIVREAHTDVSADELTEKPVVATQPVDNKLMKPKKKKSWWKWLLGIIILGLIALLAFFGISNNAHKDNKGADKGASTPAKTANKDKGNEPVASNDKVGVAKTPSFPSVTRDQETATYPKISNMADGKNPNGNDPEYYKSLHKVDVKQLVKMIKDKKSFNLYIGRPTCPDCRLYLPVQASVLKSLHKDMYYLDTDDATKVTKDKNGKKQYQLDAQTSNFLKLIKVDGTPTVVKITPQEDATDGETNIHYTTPDRSTYTDQTGSMLQDFLTK